MTDADYKALTDTLIASIDDLIAAPVPDEEKQNLLDEALSRIVSAYENTAVNRCELDTESDEVYSKKKKTKGYGYI